MVLKRFAFLAVLLAVVTAGQPIAESFAQDGFFGLFRPRYRQPDPRYEPRYEPRYNPRFDPRYDPRYDPRRERRRRWGEPAVEPERRRRPARARTEPAPPKVTVKPKDDDARKVLVVGDFLAGALASGLEEAFAEESKIAVVEKANGSSGFVRADHYDWNGKLPEILNEVGPDFVVVMVGTNDRQQLRADGKRHQVRSPEWEAAYTARLATFGDTLQVYGRPVYWVGLPPMNSSSSSADMTYFNTLFKARAEAIGARFIDVWNGFADENGRFVQRGPDVEGQERSLRAGDGINFTRAGQRKLAYYVERELRRDARLGADADALAASSTPGERIEVGPDGRKWLVGPVISLSDPPPGAATALLGEEALAAPAAGSAQHRRIVEGAALATAAGRVDDFAWPPERRKPLAGLVAATGDSPSAATDDAAAGEEPEAEQAESASALTPVAGQ